MEQNINETASALALNRIFGFEPKISRSIIDNLGSASAVFGLSRDELRDLFGPYSRHAPLICEAALEAAYRELETLKRQGAVFIAMTDPCYPAQLKECEDAPAGLYVLGSSAPEDIFNGAPAVSVFGTRDISPYGRDSCRMLVDALSSAPSRPVIVSGLAIGVDITAHLAALECGLPTIAVLPCGIDEVYPARHNQAAARIAATPGCALITDYPPRTAPVALNFLRRNRIIAGLATAGAVLVESKAKGGGMMTARLASSYGRDVYAIPGRIDDIRSEGCNMLISRKIAEPIVSFETVCADMGLGRFNRRRRNDLESEVRAKYSGTMREAEVDAAVAVALVVKGSRGITPEGICGATGMDYPEVAGIVAILEADGFLIADLLQQYSVRTAIG